MRVTFRTRPSWSARGTISFSLFLVIFINLHLSLGTQKLGERALQELSPAQISSLVSKPDPTRNLNPDDPNSHLSKILIPRPPDTDNNTRVRNYIVSTLKKLDWHVEEDSFMDNTPYGTKHFTNVIATKDPDAPRRVVVAAHFDSKFFPDFPQNQFVGATDSAMPCALMLDLAETLDPLLNLRKEQYNKGLLDDEEVAETTLQLVFFDGEEAFKDWTATDSIYGARHLAHKWATTYIQPNAKRRLMTTSTELSGVEHLILLDLLGAKNPFIQSYFLDTAWLFDAIAGAEKRLGSTGAFEDAKGASTTSYKSFFVPRRPENRNYGYIEDDHIPFLKYGVSILHIIASPFPSVWHKLSDDALALDMETMRRWNMIMRVFMSEYLGLQPEEVENKIKRDNGELPASHYNTMTSRAKRAAAPVRFASNTDVGMEDNDLDDVGDDNMVDMLSIMQEFQKKTTQKTSTRSAAFNSKKNALISAARKEAELMVTQGRAYIEQCKTNISELREQEAHSDDILKDAMGLWSAHEESFQTLLAVFPELIEELSPRRAEEINAASEMLETHPIAREASRRRLMKSAKKHMEAGIEAQKLATDANALIKHYKALLLS